MFVVDLVSLVISFLPRVEDPWPDMIGFEFPFTVAGGFGLLADVIYAEAPQARRDRAIRRSGAWGFRVGAFVYSLSLLVQLLFGR
jgi:hypothetical protein